MYLLRHLLSILILPFTMSVLVPRWLLRAYAATDTRWTDGVAAWAGRAAGVALGILGLALFVSSVWLFARVGRGTLAPWDPTRRLVAVGPYRYTRNPMISGVLAMLGAQALVAGSRVLAAWAALFFVVNTVYFVVSEEPGLRERFGDDYVRYARAVHRWVPRATPWRDPHP